MSFTAADLGDLETLATALGILDGAGQFNDDWLSNPGARLSTALANETQRNALVEFVDEILGGEERETDRDGLIWLPIVSNSAPAVSLYVVLDPTPSAFVGIGVGAKLTTTAPGSTTTVHLPIFRAAKEGQSVSDAILVGSRLGVLRVTTDITLGTAPPLNGLALSLHIPTGGNEAPTFALTLRGLLLPGATTASDLSLSLDDLDDLDDAALDLVFGLLRVQADALGAGPLASLVGLLGLSGVGTIPAFPLAQLPTEGVAALARWFAATVSLPSSQAEWLAHLASLLGATPLGDTLSFAVGGATVTLRVVVTIGVGGEVLVTPILSCVVVANSSAHARIDAELLRLDLTAMSSIALPKLSAYLQLGRQLDGSGTRLLTGDPQVDTLRAGLALDAARRPTFLLAADGVVIAGNSYATLDLTTPDTIAEVAGTVIASVVTDLLAALGPAGNAISLLIGVQAPPSDPGVTLLDLQAFLTDPMHAVREYWLGLLQDHAAAVPDILATLRDLLADATRVVTGIAGSGTEADPWRVPIVGPITINVWTTAGNSTLHLAWAASYVMDTLGNGCTRVETAIAVTIAELDLAARSALLLPGADLSLVARARGRARAFVSTGPVTLSADHVGLRMRWRPASGFGVDVLTPNLAASIDGVEIPVVLPVFDAAGNITLDADGWDGVERLLALLAHTAPVSWVQRLVDTLGWASAIDGGDRPRLRLADLVTSPRDSVIAWLAALAFDDAGEFTQAIRALAQAISGSATATGRWEGEGTPLDPWRMSLLAADNAPALATWLVPNGPAGDISLAPDDVRSWRPGRDGLSPLQLETALLEEATIARDVADLTAGRTAIAAGLSLLTERWIGGDGRIVPPTVDPSGVTVHRIDEVSRTALAASVDVSTLLGLTPDVVVHVAVLSTGEALPWPTAPANRIIDLRVAALAPDAFALPIAATGEWFVALGGRAACRLAVGDADGVSGQSARLQRVLAPFAALGVPVAIVAVEGAGHATVVAANAMAFVTAVVTIGTAFSPVSFTVIDDAVSGDALRLLRCLLPALDAAEPDDADLACGRDLVDGLVALLPLPDPAVELRPPVVPTVPRIGLAVHAVFGVLSAARVFRAVTSIVASGMAGRAVARAALPRATVTGIRGGMYLPLSVQSASLAVTGSVLVELVGADQGAPVPTVSTARSVTVRLAIRRPDGWLSGGPNGIDAPPPAELRWVSATVVLPLGAGDADAEIVLHEPTVFGISRERWVIRADGGAVGSDVTTPALPEVRVLMSLVAEQLQAAAVGTPAIAAVRDALIGLGVLDASGASIPDGIDHLLHDTALHVSDALADAARQVQLASGVQALLSAIPGVTVDLQARTVRLQTSSTPGAEGMVSATADITATGTGVVTASFTLGSTGISAAGGVLVRVDNAPLRASLEWHAAGGVAPAVYALWPTPDVSGLTRALAQLLPGECARAGLEFLRRLDETARGLIDAALDVMGLLDTIDAIGNRRVLLPAGMVRDAVGWFTHRGSLGGSSGGIDPARAIALLDAVKPLTGLSGPPGTWTLGTGVSVTASAQSGALRLALSIDTSAFASPVAATGRLVAGGTIGLTLRTDGAPTPAIDAFVGLAGATTGRSAVHVALNGGVQLFIRPDVGADLPLYPNPPGLAALAQAAVSQALPVVLDALAAETGTNLAGNAGAVVRAIGDALDLRRGTPLAFDGARLTAWAADPAGQLIAALPTLTTTALQSIATAVRPLLPTASTATVAGGMLTVTVRELSLTWRPSPFRFTLGGTVTGIPTVNTITAAITLDASGLAALESTIGPATIDAGGLDIRPFATIAVGASPSGGRRIEVGLASDAAMTSGFAARWNLGSTFTLVAVDGNSTDAEDVALAMLEELLDLVATFAIDTPTMQQLLANAVGSGTVRDVLRGVVLEDVANPAALDPDLFDPAALLQRMLRLALNFAETGPSIALSGGLTVGVLKELDEVKLTLGITARHDFPAGDFAVSLEADSRWIQGEPPAGLELTVLDVGGAVPVFAPAFACNGIGIRVGKTSGPLLDSVITLGSIAAHLYGEVETDGRLSGGVQLQFSELAVAVAGAQGGNPVAQGIMKDANSGSTKLAPAFSPALAVQKHGSDAVLISLSAGEGSGPWWVAIQKGFGPVYIEQVGVGVVATQQQLQKISLLLDGRVSLLGLTAAVDDLQLTFTVASNANVFDPGRWAVDVAGFAVNADLAGITLAGGLRKFEDGTSIEYIGMLAARFAVYGLSVYGGYGTGVASDGSSFASFFAFGAINGPIGGPPAFFLTGIGGGLGINRGLTFPSDLSTFGEFPFIKALDPAAQPSTDPMAELASLRTYFPMKSGEFWFAAGISFTSFALVDGVAVVSVAIGDGLEIALLGLARLALPRPQFPLVSIELGLIARFSTKEGVLWIQAQLTDNSWILHESVRLTGGFAFVIWFGETNTGQFVLTLGGYHPSFKRDGYPIVPRLGFQWSVSSSISIKGEAYFALTSEAVMAGGSLTASADFGAAWATVTFGADGIVYFDPFRYDVNAYARISAGVTIDTWLGDISFSLSRGASIHVMGPEFHGTVSFDVGPIGLTVAFGDDSQSDDNYISWADFVGKYLETASPGVARVITAIPGKGALPPGTGPGGPTDTATADGTAARPFEVYSEFEITVTTLVPTATVRVEGVDDYRAPSSTLGIAPMNIGASNAVLSLSLVGAGNVRHLDKLTKDVQAQGSFPIGVWGPPQPMDDRKVPTGNVIKATDAVRFESKATLNATLPKEIAYNQIDPPGPRKPLPFLSAAASRPAFITAARDVSALIPNDAPGARRTYAVAKPWLAAGGTGKTALAAIERERQSPPRLGTLTQGLAETDAAEPIVTFPPAAPTVPVDTTVAPPRAIAVLTPMAQMEFAPTRTTVKDRTPVRMAAPSVESAQAAVPVAVAARLVRTPAPGATMGRSIGATGPVPLTRAARGGTAAVSVRGAPVDGNTRLTELTTELGRAPGRRATRPIVQVGEVVILELPNALRDLDPKAPRPQLAIAGGTARIVAMGFGGEVLRDDASTTVVTVPVGTERLIVVAQGKSSGPAPGMSGWHSGSELPYIGWSSSIASGVVVHAEGSRVRGTRQRFRAGWVPAAELVQGSGIVHTRFAAAPRTVAIVLDDFVDTDHARDLALTLQHARRALDARGTPLPPIVVSIGNRSALVYAVTADPAAPKGAAVTVSIGQQPGVRLVGVLGSSDGAADVAERFARAGLDALVRPLTDQGTGTISLSWIAGRNTNRTPVRGKTPKKPAKTAVKKAAETSAKKSAKKVAKRAPSPKR